jgi:uncharacterized repeat protein (TIGR01451 family)
MKLSLTTTTCLIAFAGLALAQVAQKAQLTLESYVVISDVKDGKTTERFEPAAIAKPGSTLEYRAIAQNATAKPITKLVVDLPIPKNTIYQEGTATNSPSVATLQASADNKRSFAVLPLKRKIIKDGKSIEEIIPANQYTNLRWLVNAPVAPKTALTFKARVKIR